MFGPYQASTNPTTMSLRQTTLTEIYRYGASDMSVSRREERRWRRNLASRPVQPSPNETYTVDSAAEIAFILRPSYSVRGAGDSESVATVKRDVPPWLMIEET